MRFIIFLLISCTLQFIKSQSTNGNRLSTALNSPDADFAKSIRNLQYPSRTPEYDSPEEFVTVKKIISNSDICRAICLNRNITESFDKIEMRLTSEMRKINRKLMHIEEVLIKNLTSRFEETLKTEINAMKNEILKNLRERSGK